MNLKELHTNAHEFALYWVYGIKKPSLDDLSDKNSRWCNSRWLKYEYDSAYEYYIQYMRSANNTYVKVKEEVRS
jgi:hypothetical protein